MSKYFCTFVAFLRIIMEKISKAQVKLVRSLQQKKFRDELGLFVAEGDKCVEELRKGFELVYLIRSQESGIRNQDNYLLASPTEIEQMSGLRTPQGVVAVFKKVQRDDVQCTKGNLIVALDGIQDPGNLGTIIRTCDWFGVHDIVCSLDTADCYNPKVVQATMGALARVRIHYVDLPKWLEGIRSQESGVRIYGTLLDGKNMYEILKSEGVKELKNEGVKELKSEGVKELKSEGIIVMGNEGNGISSEVRKYISHPILIPSYSKNGASVQNEEASEVIESLNVSIATAIVLAEFRRP